nr:zinc-binding dehydrogenase [Actinoplanes polyasparticus]
MKLRVVVAATYPLAQTAEAHRGGQAGHASGKLALIP